jgi:hypothetical protein
MDELPEDLATRVLRWGMTVPGMRTAARLVVLTPWIADRGFVDACLVHVDSPKGPMAGVDWAAVAEFLGKGPEGDAEAVGALRAALDLATARQELLGSRDGGGDGKSGLSGGSGVLAEGADSIVVDGSADGRLGDRQW